jgi:hypothetical protein
MAHSKSVQDALKTKRTNFGTERIVGQRPHVQHLFQSGSGEWVINGNGTITNRTHRLMWIQAPWGMKYDGSIFSGTPEHINWTIATKLFGKGNFAYADREQSSYKATDWSLCSFSSGYTRGICSVEFAGYTDWRLPTAPECCMANFENKHDLPLRELLWPCYRDSAFWTANGWKEYPSIFLQHSMVWKAWFGRPINDANASEAYPVYLVRQV